MKDLKTTWVFDKVTIGGEGTYDVTFNLAEKPTELGLDGGKILTLIIKKNDKPFYIYDNGKVELDSNGSETILKFLHEEYNYNKTADYYLNKLLDPGTGVTGINIEIAAIPTDMEKKFKDIYKDLNGLLNTMSDSLSSGNNRALLTLDFKGKQYLMCADDSKLFVCTERDLPGDTDKQECEAPEIKHGTVPPPPSPRQF